MILCAACEARVSAPPSDITWHGAEVRWNARALLPTPAQQAGTPPAWLDEVALQLAHEIFALPENWPFARRKAATQAAIVRRLLAVTEGERAKPSLYDRAIASRLAWREEAEKLARLLVRCRTVLGNMAEENEGAIFNRWPISHEPLRADAKGLVPLLDEALSSHHKAFMASLKSTTDPEQVSSTDRGSV